MNKLIHTVDKNVSKLLIQEELYLGTMCCIFASTFELAVAHPLRDCSLMGLTHCHWS